MNIFDAIAQYKIDYPKVKIRDKSLPLSISLDDEASCFEQLANLILPNGIISGLAASLDVANHVIIQPGVWIIERVQYAINTVSTFTPDVQDATLSRYDVVYADISNHLHILSGSLSASPIIPQIPDSTLLVCTVLITPTDVTLGQPFPNGYVDLVTNQTINGIKTFVSSPQVPNGVNAQDAVAFGQLANLPQNYAPWVSGKPVNNLNLYSVTTASTPNLYLAKRALTGANNTINPSFVSVVIFTEGNNTSNLSTYQNWVAANTNFSVTPGPYLCIENGIEIVPAGSGMRTFPLFSQPVSPLVESFLRFTLNGDQTAINSTMFVYEFYASTIIPTSRGVWYELPPTSKNADIITMTTVGGYQYKLHVDVCRNANNSFFEFRVRIELIVNPGGLAHHPTIFCEFNDSNQLNFIPQRVVPSNYWKILNTGTDPNTVLPQWNGTETTAIAEIAGVTLGYGANPLYSLKTRGNSVIFNNTTSTNIVNFQVNNSIVSEIDSAGFLRGPGMGDLASLNNASISTTSIGTSISRIRGDSNPTLTVITNNTTGNISSFSNGSIVSSVDTSGLYRGPGIADIASTNNAYLQTNSKGTRIARSIPDSNAALTVVNNNTATTGTVFNIQNYYRSLHSVDAYGGIYHNTSSISASGSAKAYWMLGGLKPTSNNDKLVGLQIEPIYGTSTVSTTGSLVGGSGYPNGIQLALFTGGTGFNLVAQCTVSGGVVTAYTITDTGINYTNGDVVSFVIEDASGNPVGSGGHITITGVTSFTGISSVSAWFKNAPIQLDPISTPSVFNTGMMWQDGTHLYAYINGAVRQLDQQASGGSAGVNGLNGTANIGLGGSLSGNTSIALNSRNLSIQSLANVGLTLNDGASATLYGGNSTDYGSVNLNATNTFIGLIHSTGPTQVGFNFNSTSGATFADSTFNKGFSYTSDFSAANSSNPRWVVDKAYVDAHTFNNPMTTVGDIIIGGTVVGGAATPTRLGMGAAYSVLGVNPTGTGLEYKAVTGSSGIQLLGSPGVLAFYLYEAQVTVTNANYDAHLQGFDILYKLPVITANRTFYLPFPAQGHKLNVWNQNTAGFTWTFINNVPIAPTGASVATMANGAFYQLEGDGTNWVITNAGGVNTGTANQILFTNSAGTLTEWRSLAVGSGIQGSYGTGVFTLALQQSVISATNANITTVSTEQLFKLPTITANRTINLFSASSATGSKLYFWNTNTSASFSWSFTGSGTVTDSLGNSITTLANGVIYILESDGSNWIWLDNTASTTQYFVTGTFVGAGTSVSPFSLGQVVGVAQLTATGAPSSTTYLRGDNTWATISGGSSGASPTQSVGLTAVPGVAATFMRSDGAPALDQTIVPVWTALHTFQKNGIVATSTDAVLLQNSTASTSGVPNQWSPALHLAGTYWTGSASAITDWRIENQSTGTQGLLVFRYQNNGGGYNTAGYFSPGALNLGGLLNLNQGFLGATSTDVLLIQNQGAASAGTPLQKSGRERFFNSVWNTTATAAPNYGHATVELTGVSGTTPTAAMLWSGGLTTVTTPTLSGLMSLDLASGTLTLLKSGLVANKAGLGQISVDGLSVFNPTLATSSVTNQYSPYIRIGGNVWNTSGTPANNTTDWAINISTISGAAPTSAFTLWSSLTTGSPSYNAMLVIQNNGNAQLNGNLTLGGVAGARFFITEGTGAPVGQVALVSGTKVITISGLTTNSRAFVDLVSASGTASTTSYQGVCTANTLTLRANVAAGTINTADNSTVNYFIIN